jgi:D-alanyl-D-alanine carboxypeptidase
MRDRVISPLGLRSAEMDFVIPDPSRHAKGYLAKYSFLNLVKGFLTDPRIWGPYEGRWRRVNEHYVNGPAFGGLVGSAGAFGRFLQDQLGASSIILNKPSRELLYARQTDGAGRPVVMTLGWHIGDLNGAPYYFKEGGGGGFHSEMRVYPGRGIASVLMVNATQFNSNSFLSRLDRAFLGS